MGHNHHPLNASYYTCTSTFRCISTRAELTRFSRHNMLGQRTSDQLVQRWSDIGPNNLVVWDVIVINTIKKSDEKIDYTTEATWRMCHSLSENGQILQENASMGCCHSVAATLLPRRCDNIASITTSCVTSVGTLTRFSPKLLRMVDHSGHAMQNNNVIKTSKPRCAIMALFVFRVPPGMFWCREIAYI